MRLLVALCAALFAFPLFAASVTVGCPRGTPGDHPSITAALAALDLDGPHTITVSGRCTETGTPFSGGVSAAHSSVVMITGGEVTGSLGPGIAADAISNVRLNGVTVTGSSEEAVRLLHGSVLDSIGGNTIPAPSVTCDGTSIVFGDLTGVAAFECEKATKK